MEFVNRLWHASDGLNAFRQVWRWVHMRIVGDAPLKLFVKARVLRAGSGKEKHVKQISRTSPRPTPSKERLLGGNPADHIGEPLMKLGWCKIADRTRVSPQGVRLD